jgi:lambda family phage minor tail protein L
MVMRISSDPSPSWAGNTFDFWPFQITRPGAFNRPGRRAKLSVSNLDGHITALCLQFKDMVNAKVSIIDTYAVYLDAVNFPGGKPDR